MNPWDSSDWFRFPFEALGEGMERIGLWAMGLVCRVLGYQWITDETAYGEFAKLEGWYCGRCWKFESFAEDARSGPVESVEDGGQR